MLSHLLLPPLEGCSKGQIAAQEPSRLGLPLEGLGLELLLCRSFTSGTDLVRFFCPDFLNQCRPIIPLTCILWICVRALDHPAPTCDTRNQLYGEGPERTAWFPMVLVLDVLEEGTGDDGEDVTSQYEVIERPIDCFLPSLLHTCPTTCRRAWPIYLELPRTAMDTKNML